MPRAKAIDTKPRGRMSAYAFFVQTCREEHKKKHPDANVVFSDFSRKCAERWKTMSDEEKQPFFELADKDKSRYDSEMLDYRGPRGPSKSRKRRQKKDPNAPKRALSAFFWYCNEERPKVKAENSDMSVGEIAKELGQRWAQAEKETKSRCEEMARKDKARYLEEMKAYRGGNFTSKKPRLHEMEGGGGEDSDEEEEEDEGDGEEIE